MTSLRPYLLALAFLLPAGTIHAQAPAPLTVQDFFKNPDFRGASLSPNGESLAATVPIRGRMNLVTMSLKDRKPTTITGYDDYDVVSFAWVNNERLVYSLGNINEPSASIARQGGGLFAVDRDGKDARTLAVTVNQAIKRGDRVLRFMEMISRMPEHNDEVLVTANERDARQSDLYRVNTRTGRKTLISFDNPGDVRNWVFDREGVARAAVSVDQRNKVTTWYRKSGDAKWEKLGEYALFQKNTMPLTFGYDGTMFVVSNEGRDKYAVFTYDPEAKKVRDILFEHPDVDAGIGNSPLPNAATLVFDTRQKKLAGVRWQADLPGVKWIDDTWQRTQDALDAALPGRTNRFAPPREGSRIIVSSYSDREAVSWYLFDSSARKLEPLAASYPNLKRDQLVDMKPIRFKARDGLEVPAYLFLPKASGERKPALVVNIHGGPHVRADFWGLTLGGAMEAQFLAHNGYAVLLTNYRMTPGFGHEFYTGGVRQWGKAMHEDLEDGVDYLVKEGLVDGGRVCLYGQSYGGYATLWGLVKTPDKYKCGVAGLVISDIRGFLTSTQTDFARDVHDQSGVHFWSKMVGDPSTEATLLASISPAFHAKRIKAPLFIISGQDDQRTPIEQAQLMRSALREAGQEPEWMVAAEEGHGFAKAENRYEMYTRMLKFLDKHIGPAR